MNLLGQLVSEHPEVPSYRCMLEFGFAEAGQRSSAVEFERFAAEGFISLPLDAAWLFGMAALAETCAFLADTARAEILYELLLPYAGRNVVLEASGGGGAYLGSLSHHLGRLAATMQRWAEAKLHLDAALASNQARGATPAAERTRRALARLPARAQSRR